MSIPKPQLKQPSNDSMNNTHLGKGGSKSKYLSSSSGESVTSSESSEDSSSSEESKEPQLNNKKAKKAHKSPFSTAAKHDEGGPKIRGAPKGVKTIE
jgi:hypothetical protein